MNQAIFKILCLVCFSFGLQFDSFAKSSLSSADTLNNIIKITNLDEVIVYNNVSTRQLLHKLKADSSFYVAFQNLYRMNYQALFGLNMLNKNRQPIAKYNVEFQQIIKNKCRFINKTKEDTEGEIFNAKHEYIYTTPALYANIFLYRDTVCTNQFQAHFKTDQIKKLKGIAKHKAQLKNLLFNPGASITGVPFMGNKLNIYDTQAFQYYDYRFEPTLYNALPGFLFSIKAKSNLSNSQRSKIIFDELKTWFSQDNFDILAREYWLSYNTFFYDFNVNMFIQMTKVDGLLVPETMRYNGNFKVIFKPREISHWNSTFFNFNKP